MTRTHGYLLALGMLVMPATVLAAESVPARQNIAVAATSPELVPLSPEALDDVRAGEDTTVNVRSSQQLTATSSNNSITAGVIQNGNVDLSGNAMNGFSGVGNFVMNTGNNNVLQSNISVNIGTGGGQP